MCFGFLNAERPFKVAINAQNIEESLTHLCLNFKTIENPKQTSITKSWKMSLGWKVCGESTRNVVEESELRKRTKEGLYDDNAQGPPFAVKLRH